MAYRFARVCKLFSASRPAGVRLNVASTPRWTHTAPTCSTLHWGPSKDNPSSRLRPQWRRADVLLCRKYGDAQAMTIDQLKDSVLNVLKAFDKINPDKVFLEANFVNDLGLDSLDVVEIVMAFEDEFGVEIDDEQAEKIFTANDAIELLKNKLDVH